MRIDIIQVPYDSGHRGRRLGAGPLHLIEAGLADKLAAGGREVRVVPVELESEFPTEIASAFALARVLRDRVAEARRQERFPLVLAGNCAAAAGVVAALGSPRVLWFDAHADLNTPESSRSGFLDGMALSILLGRCWRALAAELGLEPIPEERTWLLGARDLDPAEEELLASSPVRRADAGAAPTRLAEAERGGEAYVHIDLDVLDPSVGSANQFAAPEGFGLEALLAAVDRIAERTRIAAATLSAYDPAYDDDGAVRAAALRIAERLAAAVHLAPASGVVPGAG